MAVLMSCFRCSKPILVSEEKIAAGQIPYCGNCRSSMGLEAETAAASQINAVRTYKVAKKARTDKGSKKNAALPRRRTGLFVFVLCIFLALGALGLFGVSVLVMLMSGTKDTAEPEPTRSSTPGSVDTRPPPVAENRPPATENRVPAGEMPWPPILHDKQPREGTTEKPKPQPEEPLKTVREERAIVASKTSAIAGLAFSPDGSIVVTASGGLGKLGQLRFWKATTGVGSPVVITPGSDLFGVAVRHTGDLIASAGGIAGVQLYNSKEGKLLGGYKHPSYVRAVAFSPDGALLASSCELQIKVFDLATQRVLWTGNLLGLLAPWRVPTQLAFSPSSKAIACGDGGTNVRAYDTASGKMLFVGEGHTKPVVCVAYSPDGKYLASGGVDETIRIWDVDTGKTERVLMGHQGIVHSVAFAHNNHTLASAGGDGSVILWDIATGKKITAIEAHKKQALCVTFPPTGNLLASSGGDGLVKLWDVSSVIGGQ